MSTIGEVLGQGPRGLAVYVAKHLEGRAHPPIRPRVLDGLSVDAMLEAEADPELKDVAVAFRQWSKAEADIRETNRGRLRGLLWARRELLKAAKANDLEAIDFGKLIRAYLADEWGIKNPPNDLPGCTALANEVCR
jgi:hypothetical protein